MNLSYGVASAKMLSHERAIVFSRTERKNNLQANT